MTTAVSRPGLHPPRLPDEESDEERIYKGVSFATDDYVPWMVGKLRLGKADLSRMRTSGCPVLRAHNGDNLVGAVTRCEKSGGVWRSDWRLPKKPWNADTFDQMDSGILRGVSVGGNLIWSTLKIDNEDEASWSDPDSLLFSCDWQLVEESLTPIPADVRAGVDRSIAGVLERDNAIFDTIISPSGITTLETPSVLQRLQSLVSSHNESIILRRETMATKPLEQTQIPPDVLQRAVADELARTEALKSLSEIPAKLDKIAADAEAEAERNMEYRAKLDKLQFQPHGQVLQFGNWQPGVNEILDLGKVLRLTQTADAGFPALDRESASLEESILERAELSQPGRNTVARIPWSVLEERGRQLQLQRAAMTDASGARPLMIDVLGNAGLVLSAWSPILARMDVKFGLSGAQKAPWATSQMTAAGAAEGANIPITNLVLNDVEYLPVSVASAYEITSSLRGVDNGVFEGIARRAIQDILLDQVTGQVLDGGGSAANEISGLWGLTGVQEAKYGAAQSDFSRQDALDFLDLVRLAKTDGGQYTGALSTSFWKLAESVLRGGASSDAYLLEIDGMMGQGMMEGGQGMMGRMEGEAMFHYADLEPSSIVDPGLFMKANRIVVFFWGDSLFLEYVPTVARKETFKMCAEVNAVCYRPENNVSRIYQGTP